MCPSLSGRRFVVLAVVGALIASVGVAGIGTALGSVSEAGSVQDEYPDTCENAPIVEPNGELVGSIDTPEDSDVFKLRLTKGEVVSGQVAVPQAMGRFTLGSAITPQLSERGTFEYIGGERDSEETTILRPKPAIPQQFRFYPENSGTNLYCLGLRDPSEEKTMPYEWRLTLSKETPPPTPYAGGAQSNERIDDLEATVSDLRATIESQRERITELEAQTPEGGDVTFDISVTPTQQEAFVAGGQARVEVTGVESAALDGLALTYQDTSYSVNSEGVATIPLQAAGSHDLTFTYEGTSESVTLNVQQASGSPSGGGASGETTGGVDTPATIETAQAIENENENEDGGSSGFGPGFGVVAAVVALLGAGLLAHRR